MTKVYFSNSYGILREIGSFDRKKEEIAYDCIYDFLKEKGLYEKTWISSTILQWRRSLVTWYIKR